MTTAEVRLWGTKIGAVSIDTDSPYCNFRYDPDFIRSGIELSPLMMPLSDAIYTFPALPIDGFHGLPGLLADSIPDKFGNAVIDAWLTSIGRTLDSFDIVERLCYIGIRGMGALEFHPSKSKDIAKDEDIRINQLVELSNVILSKRNDFVIKGNYSLKELIKVGTSAGGARAKAIIAFNEETKEIRSGQTDAGPGFSYWIIKFDGINNSDEFKTTSFTRIEYAYYLMALSAGIKMSESRLYREDEYYHFMTRRFDRIETDGVYDKLHMQTLGALVHRDYNQPGAMSYESAVQVMRKLDLPQSDNEEFFRRMVFNVMARNQDDHVKNISFLMNRKGGWYLSPAYDMTYAFNPEGKWTAVHQMSVNGKRSGITMHDIRKSASAMNIKERVAEKIIAEVTDALLKWNDFAEKAYIEKRTADAIKKQFYLLPTI